MAKTPQELMSDAHIKASSSPFTDSGKGGFVESQPEVESSLGDAQVAWSDSSESCSML